MIVKKMPILQGFPDFETVKFFTGKFFQKYNFTPVFYDIETTGLSRNSTYLYLIGAVGIEDETWNFYQWMAENANEEETILRIFSQFLQQCDLLISYNGDRFDQPYLEARYEKYGNSLSVYRKTVAGSLPDIKTVKVTFKTVCHETALHGRISGDQRQDL